MITGPSRGATTSRYKEDIVLFDLNKGHTTPEEE